MDYEKKYKDFLDRMQELLNNAKKQGHIIVRVEDLENTFPELKESEDEKVEKAIFGMVYDSDNELWSSYDVSKSDVLAWLDKQGNTNETVNRDEFAQGVLRGAAINLITWIDYKAAEGNMCLSNMECKDIEDALVTGDWNKIYAYMKRKLEKQGKQKPTLEDAAKLFLEALSETPYNNTPIVEAQIITKQLLTFLSDPKAYNPNAINEQKPADMVEPKGYHAIDPNFGIPVEDLKRDIKPKFREGEWITIKE